MNEVTLKNPMGDFVLGAVIPGRTIGLKDGRTLGYMIYGAGGDEDSVQAEEREGEKKEAKDESDEKGSTSGKPTEGDDSKRKKKEKKKKKKDEKKKDKEQSDEESTDTTEEDKESTPSSSNKREDLPPVPDGTMDVLFFHGNPGCRFFFTPTQAQACKAANLRVFVFERPGYGLSSPQPNRSLLDWAKDMEEVVSALNIGGGTDGQFSIIGYSAGSPFALACAHHFPSERLRAVVLLGCVSPSHAPDVTKGEPIPQDLFLSFSLFLCLFSFLITMPFLGMAPLFKVGWFLSKHWHWALRHIADSEMKTMRRDPLHKLREDMGLYGDSDSKLYLENKEIEKVFVESALEIYSRDWIAGVEAHEYTLWASPWGFDLHEISCPVRIWCGLNDRATTPAMAKFVAESVVDGVVEFVEGKGHLLIFEVWDDVVKAVKTEKSVEKREEKREKEEGGIEGSEEEEREEEEKEGEGEKKGKGKKKKDSGKKKKKGEKKEKEGTKQ